MQFFVNNGIESIEKTLSTEAKTKAAEEVQIPTKKTLPRKSFAQNCKLSFSEKSFYN